MNRVRKAIRSSILNIKLSSLDFKVETLSRKLAQSVELREKSGQLT